MTSLRRLAYLAALGVLVVWAMVIAVALALHGPSFSLAAMFSLDLGGLLRLVYKPLSVRSERPSSHLLDSSTGDNWLD